MIRRTAIALLFLPLLQGCIKEPEGDGDPGPKGNKAPEISGATVQGEQIRLSQYQGKVVLLDFWATWCPPCRNEIPHERELAQRFNGKPFAILGVSQDSQPKDLADFLQRNPMPWPNISDSNAAITRAWNVRAIPTFVLIDHEGHVRRRWEGGGQSRQIEAAVAKLVQDAEKKQTAQARK